MKISAGTPMALNRVFYTVCIAALALLVPAQSQADQYSNFTYSVSGTNATITGYTGSGGDVTIPSSISNLRRLAKTTVTLLEFVSCL